MKLQDAIDLIANEQVAHQSKAIWADLGCGTGLFTYALANILSPGAVIHAIDKSAGSLEPLSNPGNITIHKTQLDFARDPLPLQGLNGILMANSIHFIANKAELILQLSKHLSASGIFIVVEYDLSKSNPWVPYPLPPAALQNLFAAAGYNQFRVMGHRPSLYHNGNIYAALIAR